MSVLSAFPNTQVITAKDGQQHTWKSIKLLIATLIVSTLGDGFCGVMMAVALPDISETYHISLATANWVTVGYSIIAATSVMTAATLLRKIGLRKLFMWSRVLLIVSSLIGLFSLNFPMMLGSRLIQAIGAGLMFPTINTVIIRLVPPKISGQMVSANSAIIGIGIAVAPVLSGLFLTYVSLTSMYIVPLVIGIVSLIMGSRFVFDVEVRKSEPIDVPSVLLAFVGLTALTLGFSELTHLPRFAASMILVGLAVLAWFAVRQFHISKPLLNLHPMTKWYVSVGVLLFMAGSMGQQATLLLLPLYLERACGLSAFTAGLMLMVVALGYSVAVVVGGRRVDRSGMWPVVSTGFLLMCTSMFALVFTAQDRVAWVVVLIGAFALMGDALINVPDKDVVFEAVPDRDVPDTSVIFSTGSQIAGSLASALFVGILSATVLRETGLGVARDAAYASGFERAMLIAAIFEAIMGIISALYSTEMVRHKLSQIARTPRTPNSPPLAHTF